MHRTSREQGGGRAAGGGFRGFGGGFEELLKEAFGGAARGGRMGEAARRTAERFGIDAMARQLADLYGSLHG